MTRNQRKARKKLINRLEIIRLTNVNGIIRHENNAAIIARNVKAIRKGLLKKPCGNLRGSFANLEAASHRGYVCSNLPRITHNSKNDRGQWC
jgi:hypothetical protein